MNNNYVAVYEEGKEPCGAVTLDVAEALIPVIRNVTNGDYRTKPITEIEARQIRERITRCSPSTEKRLDSLLG